MSLPFFYVADLTEKTVVLDEDTSKHVISVLRMSNGEELLLTNGKGIKAKAFIIDDNRKKCTVEISSVEQTERRKNKLAIGISLIKNASRFEWFLEKATELGIDEIIPLICERTEKEKFRHDRLQQILISAMLQSQQSWMPVLHEPVAFKQALGFSFDQKFIAHCIEKDKASLSGQLINGSNKLILIGPEGDFTPKEITIAIENKFQPVSLGPTRLRTETAGIAAAVLLCISSA